MPRGHPARHALTHKTLVYLLPQIIEHAARRRPDHEAFRFKDRALTYAELLRRVNALAHTLAAEGVQPGDRVGIFTHKSLECAVAVYGILQAGAVFVPLDPTAPVERVASMLRQARVRHLVSQEAMRRSLLHLAGADTPLACVVGLDHPGDLPFRTRSWEDVYRAPGTPPSNRGTEQDLAYLIYTSGSTGEPKGIMHTHASGLSYARLAADVYGLTEHDRLSDFPPLHFDQATFGYFAGPLAGATTVIIPDEYRLLPASLSALVENERLTVWYSVPFALIQLELRGVLDRRDLGTLRWVLFGGEPFPPKHLRALMARWPHARFSNVYGPAEVNQCTYYHVPVESLDDQAPIPLGDVWPNTEGLVVDEHDRPVEPGEPGELLIRSPTMMRGYWERPDLNQQAFYYRPVTTDVADVFYRTGDLVRRPADGLLEFLGRRDRQVKIRGYRIELDEVEAVLAAHEAVAEAAAFPVREEDGEAQIEAAVVLKTDARATPDELGRFVRRHLPAYAVPRRIDTADAFPRTTSGKIDRRRLQDQAETRTLSKAQPSDVIL